MPADATTFLLAFLAVFGGLGLYLWRLDRAARRLERRVAALEGPAGTAKPKDGDAPAGPR